ncbi:hypothetical protein BDM02DRAFT_3123456 [Thelephora ganbajun]|uniref:Uncharacterized protein n=1 Tax=Thelephora ganbajun TaxID=370292 RepID=A0ACB6Z1K7_THEGA|nr:hypothetical protein BDM02DRAFT_3123456 [Thelephora ganbajun]
MIELGIVSIVLSALKAIWLGETSHKGRFFAIDLASVTPLLFRNINSNAEYFTQLSDTLQPLALD